MMDARHYRSGVKAAHDKAADTEGQGQKLLYPIQDTVFHSYKDRTDDGKGQVTCDKDADQRRHKQVKHGRNNLVQTLFNLAHDKYRDDNRNDMSLIAHQVYSVKAKPDRKSLFHTLGRYRPGVLQIRMNHHHTDDCAQIGISAEYLGRAVRNQNGQEGIRRVGK